MTGNLDIGVACAPVLRRLNRLEAIERARTAHDMWTQLIGVQAEIAQARRSAIRELRAQGMTLACIGDLLDLSTSRVKQMEQGFDKKVSK